MAQQTSPWLAAAVLGSLLGASLGFQTAHAARAGSDGQLLFEVLNRLEQLEQEIRQLRGDMDLYRYRQDEMAQRLNARLLDMERRLQALGGAPGEPLAAEPAPTVEPTAPPPTGIMEPAFPSQPPGAASPAAPGRPSEPLPPAGSEQASYDAAFGLLREGHYEEAATRFQAFLSQYPDSSLAGNAQYWLGEAYYVTRDYDRAKDAFINLGAQYPTSAKVPDALLKLGHIYQALGDKTRAREVLQKLTQAYPGSPAAQLGEQRLKSIR